MLKVSRTKGGNARINLDMDKLHLLMNHISYGCREEMCQLYEAITDFINQQNDKEETE